jgi:hypothetical protein
LSNSDVHGGDPVFQELWQKKQKQLAADLFCRAHRHLADRIQVTSVVAGVQPAS